MNRRTFLGSVAALATSLVAGKAVAEELAEGDTVVVPPAAGQSHITIDIAIGSPLVLLGDAHGPVLVARDAYCHVQASIPRGETRVEDILACGRHDRVSMHVGCWWGLKDACQRAYADWADVCKATTNELYMLAIDSKAILLKSDYLAQSGPVLPQLPLRLYRIPNPVLVSVPRVERWQAEASVPFAEPVPGLLGADLAFMASSTPRILAEHHVLDDVQAGFSCWRQLGECRDDILRAFGKHVVLRSTGAPALILGGHCFSTAGEQPCSPIAPC